VETVAGHNGDRASTVRSAPAALAFKRTLDATVAAAGLVVLSPVLAALAAVILIEDGRPVLFRQERAGRDGEPFTIYKFRTMIRDASSQGAGLAVNEGDERILRFGDAYRRLGLDELPQLWNVLRGDMSLVGPRPLPLRDVRRFSDSWLMRRFSVLPGLTGLWQVTARAHSTFGEALDLDVAYVHSWSLGLDLRLLFRTPLQLLRPSGTR